MNDRSHRGVLIAGATLLGIGLGGFLDGILFHQILQWHHMLSNIVVPTDLDTMKYNMAWDGMFHAMTWILTAVGLALLWRAGQRADVPWSTRTFIGSLVLGWGLFNLVEGVVDHHILVIHHVRPGENQLAWDLGFLAVGAVLVAVGAGLIRAGRSDVAPRGARAGFERPLTGPGTLGTASGTLGHARGSLGHARRAEVRSVVQGGARGVQVGATLGRAKRN
jgi:uncharacterized membrane protein